MNDFTSFYRNKKVLITGVDGFLGPKLAQTFSGVPCGLFLLSRGPRKIGIKTGRVRVSNLTGDITKQKTWEKILPGKQVVFHLAAYEHQRGSEFNPQMDLKANSQSVLLMLEVCRLKNLRPKIVFASSANLFGVTKKIPVNESFADNPLTLYSIHKLTAEKYLELYARDYGIPSVVLRLANLYGPSTTYQKTLRPVLNRIMDKALAGGPLKVFKNRSNIRDYLYIDDAVNAFLAAGKLKNSGKGERYVIGSQQKITIGNAVNLIADLAGKLTGKKVKVDFDKSAEVSTMEFRDFVADSLAFVKATGWNSKVPFNLGIKTTLGYILNHK